MPDSSTYPSSGFFARSSLGWTAFLASLPAPGGRTEECGGRGASAPETEDRRDPRREAGVFCWPIAGGRRGRQNGWPTRSPERVADRGRRNVVTLGRRQYRQQA